MLVAAIQSKIQEQIELTDRLAGRITLERLDWKPPVPGAWPVGKLLGHLLECMAGFCAVLAAARPEELKHFDRLRSQAVNHFCDPAEAGRRIAGYREAIDDGFRLLLDADLDRRLPTVFVPQGETVLTLLLGNLEHLINHKHELFVCLRLMGVDVGTRDLYRFRGE